MQLTTTHTPGTMPTLSDGYTFSVTLFRQQDAARFVADMQERGFLTLEERAPGGGFQVMVSGLDPATWSYLTEMFEWGPFEWDSTDPR